MNQIARELASLVAVEYLATYADHPEPDLGSRCGYSDLELQQIRTILARRGLRLEADDHGLQVRA